MIAVTKSVVLTFDKIHIVNNLKIKMLVDIDILMLENISIMLLSKKAIVNSYDNIELSLTVIT